MPILIFLLAILLPIQAQATTFWDENFDAATSNWASIANGSPLALNSGVVQIRTDVPTHSGVGAAVIVFSGHGIPVGTCLPGSSTYTVQCGGFWDRHHTASSEIWARWWIYAPSTLTIAAHTKIIKTVAGDTGLNYTDWTDFHDGNPDLVTALQDVPAIGQTTNFYFGPTLSRNTWVCVESRTVLNTPGVANGIQEQYINGVLVNSGSTYQFRQASDSGLANYVRIGRQDGDGEMYLDDLAVGDTRIGCGATVPTSDTTPPTAASITSVTANSAAQATIVYTNGTDTGGSGYAGVDVLRCSGAACTPSGSAITHLGATTTSYVDASLSASTKYGFALVPTDNAGNRGTQSATSYVTTPATFARTLGTVNFGSRSDSADLGTDFDANLLLDPGKIVSGQAEATTVNIEAAETYNAVATPNDQWCQVTVGPLGGSIYVATGCILRANTVSHDFMVCAAIAHNVSKTTAIWKYTGGVFASTPASETAHAWQQGDKLFCEWVGTTLRVSQIRAGVSTQIFSITDSSFASGITGVYNWVETGGDVLNTGLSLFAMGDYSVTAPAAPTVDSLTLSTTGATITTSNSPTSIKLCSNPNGIDQCVVLSYATDFPSGVYTQSGGWAANTTYACFYAVDALGNVTTTPAGTYQCGNPTTAGVTVPIAPPVMSNAFPTTHLPAGTTSTTIGLTTNETATCAYDTTDIAYASMANTFTVVAGINHSATVTGLTDGSTTTYYARCSDTASTPNVDTSSLVITVIVDNSTADTTAPVAPTNLVATALSQTQAQLVWTAGTDNVGVGGYRIFVASDAACTTYVPIVPDIGPTTYTLVNLTANASYCFELKTIDTSNNLSAGFSNVATVTTMAAVDTTPPSDMTNLSVLATYTQSILLGWPIGTDNMGSVTAIIESCTPGPCTTGFSVVKSQIATQTLLANLSPGVQSCFRGKFSDSSGNVSTNNSNIVCGTTTTSGLTQPRLTIPFGVSRLPRN